MQRRWRQRSTASCECWERRRRRRVLVPARSRSRIWGRVSGNHCSAGIIWNMEARILLVLPRVRLVQHFGLHNQDRVRHRNPQTHLVYEFKQLMLCVLVFDGIMYRCVLFYYILIVCNLYYLPSFFSVYLLRNISVTTVFLRHKWVLINKILWYRPCLKKIVFRL